MAAQASAEPTDHEDLSASDASRREGSMIAFLNLPAPGRNFSAAFIAHRSFARR